MTDTTTSPPAAHSPAWFEEAFKDAETPIPEDIRRTAVRIIETHDIRGICDPMYVANLIAMYMQRGNGCSRFKQGPMVYVESREPLLEAAAVNLAFAYSSSKGVTKTAIYDALLQSLSY